MGRRRLFDIDEALDAAMREFCLKGYEGTSLSDLTTAMGIERPSLYQAFGSKEELFRRVLARYEQRYLQSAWSALAAPTASAVAEAFLERFLCAITDERMPPGCLNTHAAIACSAESETVRLKLLERRSAYEQALEARFDRSIADGDLPANADASALARYIISVSSGLALQAKGGASRAILNDVVRIALGAFPARPASFADGELRTTLSSDPPA